MTGSRLVLGLALFSLSLLFSVWMHEDRYRTAALLVFALPPLLLLAGVVRGSRKAAFWSGVLGLLWFCHGIIVAYGRPEERAWGSAEIVLAVVVVMASSWPGVAGRFRKKKA